MEVSGGLREHAMKALRLPSCLLATVCLTCCAARAASLPRPYSVKDPIERLRAILAWAKADPASAGCVFSAASGLEFDHDDPKLEEAALLFDGIASVLDAAPADHVRAYDIRNNAKYARSNAEALRSTPMTLPLGAPWTETARARGDLDGDGTPEVIVAARHENRLPRQHVLLVFERDQDRHRLARGRIAWRWDIQGLDVRDFDGDGDVEVVARVYYASFGTGGGACVHYLEVMEPTGAPFRLRTALRLPLKTVDAWWRDGSRYDEVTATCEGRDADGDGKNDIVVRFERREGKFISHKVCRSPEPFAGYEPTPLMRTDTFLRKGDRFALDVESMRQQWTRLLERAGAMPPEEGIRFVERVERDFRDARDLVYNVTVRLDERPVVFPADANFVKAGHHLALGEVRTAYELFLRSHKTAETCEHLARICEGHFREPGEAAEWYTKAVEAGAHAHALQPKMDALRREATGVRYLPLRPGEIAECEAHEVRVIERKCVWEGKVAWRSNLLWLDDGRLLLVGSRIGKGPFYAWLVDAGGAREPEALRNAHSAARSRTELVLRIGRHGKRNLLLRGIQDDETRPWPGNYPVYGLDRISLSPDGQLLLSARSRGGAGGGGEELLLSRRDGHSKVILERCGTSDLLGWTAEGDLVARVDWRDIRIYSMATERWRDLEDASPGPGSYDACFSPGGTHAASLGRGYHQTHGGGLLWVSRTDGGGACPIDFERKYESPIDLPSWSPDGTRLVVTVYDRPKKGGLVMRVHVLTLGRRETGARVMD